MLFSDKEGRAELMQLIETNDMEVHPRGKLVYHVELISLLAED